MHGVYSIHIGMSAIPSSSASAVPVAIDNGHSVHGTSDVDCAYLDLAWRLMDELHCGPLLSNFRVFSILTFTIPKPSTIPSSSTPLYYSASPPSSLQHPHSHSVSPTPRLLAGVVSQRHPHLKHEHDGLPVHFLTGTNTESVWLGGSICAERSALTQLRQIPYGRVLAVYLVSQLATPLAPGMMCREMLLQFLSLDSRIVMAARQPDSGSRVVKAMTMGQLYPHPPLHLHVSSPHLVAYSQHLASERPDPVLSSLPLAIKHQIVRLLSYDRFKSPSLTSESSHYPLRFSASVFVLSADDNCTSSVSCESSYLDEWSHSQDPLTASLPLLPALPAHTPSALLFVQHDQYGVLHAPFASARAHLTQRGYGDAWCVFHERRVEAAESNGELELVCVRVGELVVDGGDLSGVDLVVGQRVLC